MAEIQNNFIKSKMNKDLDDRLVPSGEYRDALNIAISRSEGDDVGALETILGNELSFDEENKYTCIGLFSDNNNNKIYYFVTNYIDSSSSGISNFAPLGAHCSIRVYDTKLNQRTILVQGSFLNFSSRSQITGVNIVENLLFWTDNRNQPRKINIDNAVAFPAAPPQSGRSTSVNVPQPYYTKEDQISVAKYYPYTPISLMDIYNTDLGNTPNASTMTNPSQLKLADGNTLNPDYEATFPGDPDYLSDKFIRLSYRFKFDDNEYSLIAPFTQPCFVPKQNGYFLDGDNEKAYRSTIVDFFENNVTQIIASIQFETRTPSKDLKIKEVDILYKESDALIVKVIETISIKDVETVINENYARTGNGYWYNYKYISKKPYKTLTEDQITRVFDKVPVRALAQEVSGNRVIYGNFITTQSPPSEIDYYVTYGDKSLLISSSQIEYPNHTLKQNRNYQVGFVLADRYGRQSSVVLSSNDTFAEDGGTFYGGSTIYVPYSDEAFSTINWPGYALKTLVNAPIPSLSQSSTPGYPGLYKDETYGVDSALITDGGSGYNPGSGTIYTTTSVTGTGSGLTVSVGVGGGGGGVIGATVVNPGAGYADGDVVTIDDLGNANLATIKVTVLPPNPTGWHSYKIVIKQTQQDYYNVYLPGILRGYPQSYIDSSGNSQPVSPNEGFEVDETANIVLISDNINKIPKDLSEVGPVQKQYRSSVELFGRVKPLNESAQGRNFNRQNYPSSVGDTVVSISTLSEANYNATTLGNIDSLQENRTNPNSIPGDANYAYTTVSEYSLEYKEFYQSNTDPYIARISTVDPIGKVWSGVYKNQLAVYETNPVESLLDIYWETTSSGLISDLNQAVFLGGDEGAVQDGPNTFVLSESDLPGAQCFSSRVSVVNSQSNIMFDNMTFALIGITDDTGASRDGDFVFEQQLGGTPGNPDGFQFFSAANAYFYYGSNQDERTFNFYINCTYTNPSTLIETSRVISLLNRKLANRPPRFVERPITEPRVDLQCPVVGIGPGGLVPVQSLVDEDVLVYTWMAVNGSAYQGTRDLEEIQFAQAPELLIDSNYFYTKWGNQLPGRPAEIEVWLKAGAGFIVPYQPIVRIIARDAAGAEARCQFTAQVTPPIAIDFDFNQYDGICNVDTEWNFYTGGKVRFPMQVSNLDTTGTYDYVLTFAFAGGSGNNVTLYGNAPEPDCGWPIPTPGSGTLYGQIINQITPSKYYWIELTFYGVTNLDSINFSVSITDVDNILAPYVSPVGGWTISAQNLNNYAQVAPLCPIDTGCLPPP